MPEGTPAPITPTDYHSALFPIFPKDIVLANGDHIFLPWYDGEELADYSQQSKPDDPTYPYATYSLIWESVRDATHRHYSVSAPATLQDPFTDTILYSAQVDTYDLDSRDVASITEVRATVATVPDVVLTEGVDYELNDDDGDTIFDSIKFLAGGTTPDDNTNFEVDYLSRIGREHRVIRSIISFRLTIHVKDLEIGEGANSNLGINGATKRYNKSHLASQIAEYTLAHLHLKQGEGLLANEPGALTLGAAYAVGRSAIDQSQSTASYTIDIFLKRKYRQAADDFYFIGDVRFNTTPIEEPSQFDPNPP